MVQIIFSRFSKFSEIYIFAKQRTILTFPLVALPITAVQLDVRKSYLITKKNLTLMQFSAPNTDLAANTVMAATHTPYVLPIPLK